MAAMSSLTDPFNQTTLNTTLWAQVTGGTTTIGYAAGGATVTLPASATASDIGEVESGSYDLTGSYAYLQVTAVPSASTNAYAALTLADTGSANYLHWLKQAATLYAQYYNGTTTTVTSFAYSATTHKWWRIRESGGVTSFDTSPDGSAWTTQGTVADTTHGITLTAMSAVIQAACYEAETSPGTFTFADFNTGSTSLAVTTGTLPDATIGTAYSQTLSATGGTLPYTWAITSGSLPPGLTLT